MKHSARIVALALFFTAAGGLAEVVVLKGGTVTFTMHGMGHGDMAGMAMGAAPVVRHARTEYGPGVDMRVDTPHAGAAGGTSPGVRTPIRLAGSDAVATRGVPRLGEHTAEVLAEIGMGGRQAGTE